MLGIVNWFLGLGQVIWDGMWPTVRPIR